MQVVKWHCGVCGASYNPNEVKQCIICLENFQNRKSVSKMTPNERGQEIIELLTGPFGVIPIETLAERIEELLGRRLEAYDIACGKSCAKCRQALSEEARSRQ